LSKIRSLEEFDICKYTESRRGSNKIVNQAKTSIVNSVQKDRLEKSRNSRN
jgi:hypothetical protein